MYKKDYDEAIEQIKTVISFAKDYSNMQCCEQNVREFVRKDALDCLQKVLHEYRDQIDFFGAIVDGVKVCYNIDIDSISDENIKNQLTYITKHIPVYVLMREGEKEIAKRICEWMRK